MAKKTTKKVNNNELDGQEFFAAIAQIEQEKGIKPGYMMEKITQALVSAYRRDHEGVGDNLVVDANPETNTVRMFLKKDVVEGEQVWTKSGATYVCNGAFVISEINPQSSYVMVKNPYYFAADSVKLDGVRGAIFSVSAPSAEK